MTVIQKYIEFLKEYNKLLEKGSKNILRLKNTLWTEDIEESSIVTKNAFDDLFRIGDEQTTSSILLEVKRPLPKKDDQEEDDESFQEKFDRETYSFLYKAARDSKKNSSLEFVYSFGLFHLKLGETMVKVHLFHIPLTAVINGDRVSFKLHINEDPYIDAFFLNHPQIDREQLLIISNAFEKGIEEDGVGFLKSSDFKTLLNNDTLSLHPSLVFDPSTTKPLDTLTTNFVKFSPCFVLRNKRPRHFQKLMSNIIDFTSQNDVKPPVLDVLLGQKDNLAFEETHYFRGIYESYRKTYPSLELSDFEQFFPLPYNKEQLAVYKNYKTHDLSVVTGPPGTGKSHSIVNLLCAMLAEGKRILVTAKTDKALESLLDKIPLQFNGLVMADIKQQNHTDYTLSNSVGNIRELLLNNNSYNIDLDLDRLNQAKEQYNSEKTILAQLLSQEHEKIDLPYFERDFNIYELYTFVEERKNEWDFLKDSVNEVTLESSRNIIKTLKKHIHLHTVEKQFSTINFDEVLSLLKVVEFETFHSLDKELKSKLEILKVPSLENFNIVGTKMLLKSLEPYQNYDIINSKKDVLKTLNDKHLIVTEVIEDYQINKTAVEVKKDRAKYLRDITTYLALLPKGKDRLSFIQKNFNSLYKSVKYIEQISVNDVFCNNRKSLIEFRKFLIKFSDLNELIELLIENNFVEFTIKEQCSLNEMRKIGEKGLKKVTTNIEVLDKLNEVEIKEFAENYNLTNLDCDSLVTKAKELVMVFEAAKSTNCHKKQVGEAIKEIEKIASKIGVKSFNNSEDIIVVKNNLEALREAHIAQKEYEETTKILKDYIPKTLDNIKVNGSLNISNINEDSLYLKYGAQQVENATSIDLQKTSERLRHATDAIKDCKSDILSGLAKDNFKNRFDETEKNKFINLLTKFDYEFKQSKRGIADKDKFRRNAQQTAIAIAPNISCWVMKFDDVLKTVDTTPEVFDCIITDEASQLNFNSLLLGYFGKKMVVVGDEKQTSPEDISITNEAFDSLRKNNLDFMGANAINIRADASLFSLANLVAGTTNQMLREHFRCVPELIEFSKKYFYENKLIPLKVITADRLTPKKRVYIKDAFVQDKIVKKEIAAISNMLKDMLEDPAYNNKTIGVISLGLAKHTQALKAITEDFSIAKLEKHNIIVDSPPEFQGDERDVIIVSLGVGSTVNDDNTLSGPAAIVDNIENNLTSKLRGLNVGLSRAKEQMILFHSIEPNKLKTTDFRRKIITFFDEKFTPVVPFELPPDLEKQHRIPENRPKPFDSWFEYDVARSLIDKGFQHIVPQYEIKKKELFHNPKLGKDTYVRFIVDIVVYNNGTPLAIECDGDAFHSSIVDVAYDIERQEFLERIGWKIHRVTYSSFRIDPEREIEKLMSFIERNSHRQAQISSIDEIEDNVEELIDSETSQEDFIALEDEHQLKFVEEIDSNNREKFNTPLSTQTVTPNLFSFQGLNSNNSKAPSVEINSKCKIVMIDMKNKEENVLLMDIPRNQQPKSRDGIQIVSIYSDLGKLLLGNREGDTLLFAIRNQRIRIAKVY